MSKGTRFGCLLFIIGFPINLIFEYLHMPLFEVHVLNGYIDSRSLLSICSALWNILWTFLIFILMKNIFGPNWTTNWNFQKVLVVVLSGAVLVSIGERIALLTDMWSYSALMPIIPILSIGLTPFLVISIVPVLSMYLASRFP